VVHGLFKVLCRVLYALLGLWAIDVNEVIWQALHCMQNVTREAREAQHNPHSRCEAGMQEKHSIIHI
jgi:hypothetical protein